jgi:hypothetical protein
LFRLRYGADFNLAPKPYSIIFNDYNARQPLNANGALNTAGDVIGALDDIADGGGGGVS